MPVGNPTPLEKQLLHLDLSKGLNQNVRPETGNPQDTLVTVENLVQDQTGAWVKRNGMYRDVIVPGSEPASRTLRLRDGLGVVDGKGRFYHYRETVTHDLGTVRGVNEFSLSAAMVGTSSPDKSGISSVATSTRYIAVATLATLVIYERASSCVLATYDWTNLGGLGATDISSVALVFADDQYLHVHVAVVNAVTGGVRSFVIDTYAALPATIPSGTMVRTSMTAAGGPIILDTARGPGVSYVLVAPYATGNVIRMTNASAVTTGTLAGALSISYGNTQLYAITQTNIYSADPVTMVFSGPTHGRTGLPPQTDLISGLHFCNIHATSTGTVWLSYTTLSNAVVPVQTTHIVSFGPGFPVLSGSQVAGWVPAGAPFSLFVGVGSPVETPFIHMRKETYYSYPGQTGVSVPHVIIPLDNSDVGVTDTNKRTPYDTGSYTSHRVAAVLEAHLGLSNAPTNYSSTYLTSGNGLVRIHPIATGFNGSGQLKQYDALVPVITNQFTVGTMIVTAGQDSGLVAMRGNVTQGNIDYVSGGTVSKYGGQIQDEVGFVDQPILKVTAGGTVAGSLSSGSYKYVAVYRCVDETGAVTFSRCSQVQSVVLGAAQDRVTVDVIAPSVTGKNVRIPRASGAIINNPGTRCVVDIYRTTNGGTTFYRVSTSDPKTFPDTTVVKLLANTTNGTITYDAVYELVDQLPDNVASTASQLYRQPGTPNTSADRYTSPGGNIICQHKDRLFVVDPIGSRVYYSSFFVDGETAWFNPTFSFFVHGGSGPITALASMDGRLFIFKQDSVFVVDGDGPSESGPTGNEFSPPQKLSTEQGCIDRRSVQTVSDGILYRSNQGIQLLTRSLSNKFVGARVWQLTNAYEQTLDSFVDKGGRIRWSVYNTSIGSKIICYDPVVDSWSTATPPFYPASGMTMANLNGAELPVYGDVAGGVWLPYANYYDYPYTSYIPFTLETGWIKTGQQARAKYSKILSLLKRNAGSNHKITVTVWYDYNDTPAQTYTWDADVTSTSVPVEQLELNLERQDLMAVKFRIQDGPPTDQATYPQGDARGPDVLGITFQVAAKTGVPQNSSEQRQS